MSCKRVQHSRSTFDFVVTVQLFLTRDYEHRFHLYTWLYQFIMCMHIQQQQQKVSRHMPFVCCCCVCFFFQWPSDGEGWVGQPSRFLGPHILRRSSSRYTRSMEKIQTLRLAIIRRLSSLFGLSQKRGTLKPVRPSVCPSVCHKNFNFGFDW